MKNNESQYIINEITTNPELISVLSPEILLLKFLRLTKHNSIRRTLIANNNISMCIGYISKILQSANIKFIHLFQIKGNYYINNNYYDYFSDNNDIKTLISKDFSDLNNDQIFKKNLDIIITNPDIIIIQDESAEIIDTNLMKHLLSKKDMNLLLNLKTYDKSNIDNINGNYYKLSLIMTNDKKVYFNSQGKQYLYYKGDLKETSWDKYRIKSILSIYNRKESNVITPYINNSIIDMSLS